MNPKSCDSSRPQTSCAKSIERNAITCSSVHVFAVVPETLLRCMPVLPDTPSFEMGTDVYSAASAEKALLDVDSEVAACDVSVKSSPFHELLADEISL